eukprot:1001904-Pelagomonas_calceolata.AAC.1
MEEEARDLVTCHSANLNALHAHSCPCYGSLGCVPSLTHALGRTCLTGLFRELATGRVLLQKLDSFPKVASHCVPNHPKLLRPLCALLNNCIPAEAEALARHA